MIKAKKSLEPLKNKTAKKIDIDTNQDEHNIPEDEFTAKNRKHKRKNPD